MEVLSTAPSYVLITVVDGRSGEETQIATSANFLRGAIGREYDIPSSVEGVALELQVALSARDRRFTFHKRAALDNIKPYYTPAILAEVRHRVSSLTDADIRAGLPGSATDYEQTLHSIYIHREPWKEFAAYRDALAHVLLERHILCGRADRSGQLYVDRDPCPRTRQ